MIMGCVIERAFKDEYVVHLVRAPEVPGDVYIEGNKHIQVYFLYLNILVPMFNVI